MEGGPAGAMQLRHKSKSTSEGYIRNIKWQGASPPQCPWHGGECRLQGRGTYERKTTVGMRVRRFPCPESGRTASLLPGCMAARLHSTVEEVERVVDAARGTRETPPFAGRLRTAPRCPTDRILAA